MTSQVELSTKTFGKKAKQEAFKILKQSFSFKFVSHASSYVLRNKDGVMIAHVDTGNHAQGNAKLVIV